MSQYPVESDEQLFQAVNYLLSGPGGLGQNFSGFSSYSPAYLTGNFRIPFTQTNLANLYVPAGTISLSNAEQLDDRTIKYTFTTPQASPPFALGNGLRVTGITPSTYNSANLSIGQIGVVECTTTYVIVRNRDIITTPLGTYVSGGDISYKVMDAYNSTDCDVRVTVTGGTDRVFISGQLDQTIDYEVVTASADMTVYVEINRYTAFPNNNPTNPDYIFDNRTIIVEKAYEYTGLTGTGTINLETVFTSVIDEPDTGYYRYILEVYFETFGATTDIYVTSDELKLRGTTAQVVKQ